MSWSPDIPCTDKIYYVRVSFEVGDGRGCPRPAPAPEEDHLAAYKPFLHPTKEAALEALFQARRAKTEVRSETLYSPPAWMPEYEGPLQPYQEYICACSIDENGELDLVRRVYFIDLEEGFVTPLSFDEDFLISLPRDYIFETWKTVDVRPSYFVM
jgi:hypothetical protein